ncbi:MAG: hypothetical protein A3C90_02240 [Candidatus Magasanikbacteria bacterium RIFCSPHIGHO2_02_FULL_51_14]|uniref:Uncharacterized protein n=1 Tax=Candidatus Magasanikbacteria bacterium RIFCSPHIGHO2_02_FULL_51_14 TaxID=1798683 RepID=A0A1F6MQY7_9BACT|nr:MAG: hypothetical protein A3C90_02240 [Candidatus Magasanikbacteria bacterium RIFCSPHIGHO2_02_FULL_51_14]
MTNTEKGISESTDETRRQRFWIITIVLVYILLPIIIPLLTAGLVVYYEFIPYFAPIAMLLVLYAGGKHVSLLEFLVFGMLFGYLSTYAFLYALLYASNAKAIAFLLLIFLLSILYGYRLRGTLWTEKINMRVVTGGIITIFFLTMIFAGNNVRCVHISSAEKGVSITDINFCKILGQYQPIFTNKFQGLARVTSLHQDILAGVGLLIYTVSYISFKIGRKGQPL